MVHEMETENFSKWAVSHVPVEYVNNGGHVNCWTIDKLNRFLSLAGFRSINVSSYGNSEFPIFRKLFFDKLIDRSKVSLYEDAKK